MTCKLNIWYTIGKVFSRAIIFPLKSLKLKLLCESDEVGKNQELSRFLLESLKTFFHLDATPTIDDSTCIIYHFSCFMHVDITLNSYFWVHPCPTQKPPPPFFLWKLRNTHSSLRVLLVDLENHFRILWICFSIVLFVVKFKFHTLWFMKVYGFI